MWVSVIKGYNCGTPTEETKKCRYTVHIGTTGFSALNSKVGKFMGREGPNWLETFVLDPIKLT